MVAPRQGRIERRLAAILTAGMRRREFIALLGGALSWPKAVFAQQPDRLHRVGMLHLLAEDDPMAKGRTAALRQGLEELGWIEGRNIRLEYRYAAGDPDRTRKYAAELVSLRPDVIVVNGTSGVAALQQETRTTPIVFIGASDAVGSGFVESLARPGGNTTGFTYFEPSMGSKWLEMLKEIAPGILRVALMHNPEMAAAGGSYFMSAFETAADRLAVKPIGAPVHNEQDIEPRVAALGREPGSGLIIIPDIFTVVHRKLIVSLTARFRIPTIYPYGYMVAQGGLLSYGPDTIDLHRRAASYVDRILKGASPGELPVQAPTKFELIINLKTAKAINLTIPEAFLLRADEVIE
jgi:putative tryptophan/tyrosine transport system substrate-binding protein